MAERRQDPREIITPDAFSVAPELLGRPLARPWRRAVAMAIDLIAVGVLGSAGWFFLGLGLALLLFRAAVRAPGGRARKGTRRLGLGALATLVLVATLVGGWWSRSSRGAPSVAADTGVLAGWGLGDAGGAVVYLIALTRAESEQEMREAAIGFAEGLRRQGVSSDEIAAVLEDIAVEKDAPWARDAVRSALAAAGLTSEESKAAAVEADSLALAYAAALQAGDAARAAELRRPLGEAPEAERLARQRDRIERLVARNARLARQLEEERARGLVRTLLRAADEIGIGFGWAGLYFTVFVSFWGGRTPGKRLMGIRIVRLDGKPIGLWAAFNRFGGYAASIFTGLLGFLEMLWDPNRQALHDRIASTVVVRE
jgi:hypothetical protein